MLPFIQKHITAIENTDTNTDTNTAILTRETLKQVLINPIKSVNNKNLNLPEQLQQRLANYVDYHHDGLGLQLHETSIEDYAREQAYEDIAATEELVNVLMLKLRRKKGFTTGEDGRLVYDFDGFHIPVETLEMYLCGLRYAAISFARDLRKALRIQHSGDMAYRDLKVKDFDALAMNCVNAKAREVLPHASKPYCLFFDHITPAQIGDKSAPDVYDDPKAQAMFNLVMNHVAPKNIDELFNAVWLLMRHTQTIEYAAFVTVFAFKDSDIFHLYIEMQKSYKLPDQTRFSEARDAFMKHFETRRMHHQSYTEFLISQLVACITRNDHTLDQVMSAKNIKYATNSTSKNAIKRYPQICKGFAEMMQFQRFADCEDDLRQMFNDDDMNTIATHPDIQSFHIGAKFCPHNVLHMWAVLYARIYAEKDVDECLNEFWACCQSMIQEHYDGDDTDSDGDEFEYVPNCIEDGDSRKKRKRSKIEPDYVLVKPTPVITRRANGDINWKGLKDSAFFNDVVKDLCLASQRTSPKVRDLLGRFKNPIVTDSSGDLTSSEALILPLEKPRYLDINFNDLDLPIKKGKEWSNIWAATILISRCTEIIGTQKPDTDDRRTKIWANYVKKISTEVESLQRRSDEDLWKPTIHLYYQVLLQYFSTCMIQAENLSGNKPFNVSPLYAPQEGMTKDVEPHHLFDAIQYVDTAKYEDCEYCQSAPRPPYDADTKDDSFSDEEDMSCEESSLDEEDEEQLLDDENNEDDEDNEDNEVNENEENSLDTYNDKVPELNSLVVAALLDLVDELHQTIQIVSDDDVSKKSIASCLLEIFKCHPHELSFKTYRFSHTFLVEVAELVVEQLDDNVAKSTPSDTTDDDTDTDLELSREEMWAKNMTTPALRQISGDDLTKNCTCLECHVSKYAEALDCWKTCTIECEFCQCTFVDPEHEPTYVMDRFSETKMNSLNLCTICVKEFEKDNMLASQNVYDAMCKQSTKAGLTQSAEEDFNADAKGALLRHIKTTVKEPSFASRMWGNRDVANALLNLYGPKLNTTGYLRKYVEAVIRREDFGYFLKDVQKGYMTIQDWLQDPDQNEEKLVNAWKQILLAHIKDAELIKEFEAFNTCPWCNATPVFKTELANLYVVELTRGGKVLGVYNIKVQECPQPCHDSAEHAETFFPHDAYMQTDPLKVSQINDHTKELLTIILCLLKDYYSNALDKDAKYLFIRLERRYGKDLLEAISQIVANALEDARINCPDALLEEIPEDALVWMNNTFSVCGDDCMQEFKESVHEVYEKLESDPIFASLAIVKATERQSSRPVAQIEEPIDPVLDMLINAGNSTESEPMQVDVPEPMQVDVPEPRDSEVIDDSEDSEDSAKPKKKKKKSKTNPAKPKKKKSKTDSAEAQAQNFADQFAAMLANVDPSQRDAFLQGMALCQAQQI
jgi:hypothetical protein